ncbi:MAG: type II toxin-antitoxin system Phd/YefM family antitoxin [Actinomycetota bacterium]
MPEIGIKGLKAEVSRVITEVSGGASYVVTKRGRPAAVIVPVEDAEDIVLAQASAFVNMRRRGREDYRRGRTAALDELG